MVMTNQIQNGSGVAEAYFGGGCFWCTEALFKRLKGVTAVYSGYAGGQKPNPTYEEVSSGETGHAEVIKVEYDPNLVGYKVLLSVFFATHNPTTLNQQGADIGAQYRSIILYTDDTQKTLAEKFIKELETEKYFDKPIVTEIKKLEEFYLAEGYHQDYFEKNREAPYCEGVIAPKIEKLVAKFKDLLAD
jgi:peptide-methionine (S)-S-oxide reductase